MEFLLYLIYYQSVGIYGFNANNLRGSIVDYDWIHRLLIHHLLIRHRLLIQHLPIHYHCHYSVQNCLAFVDTVGIDFVGFVVENLFVGFAVDTVDSIDYRGFDSYFDIDFAGNYCCYHDSANYSPLHLINWKKMNIHYENSPKWIFLLCMWFAIFIVKVKKTEFFFLNIRVKKMLF